MNSYQFDSQTFKVRKIIPNVCFKMKLLFTIWTFLFTTVLAQNSCYIQGQCQDGLELDSKASFSYYQCLEQCQKDLECNFFTYDSDDNLCHLLANCTQVNPVSCPNCYSGEKDCPNEVIKFRFLEHV